MVFFVTVGVQTLKLISFGIAFATKIKIVAVLAHPTILNDHFFTVKTFYLLFLQVLFFKNCLKLMISPMSL